MDNENGFSRIEIKSLEKMVLHSQKYILMVIKYVAFAAIN